MNTTHLFIIRGISGAGKSTLASTLAPTGRDISADDFMHQVVGDRTTPYTFDGEKLTASHEWCEAKVQELLMDGSGLPVVVANTFTCRWEMESYLLFCKENDIRFTVCDLYDGGCSDQELAARNHHGVPVEGIERMRARYEHNWRTANPVKPWLRG
jgi:predicted kinase